MDALAPAPATVTRDDPAALDAGAEALAAFLAGRRALVLSGAGVSTDSGIPDYRGPGRVRRDPMRYQQFVGSAAHRRRYWARSSVGWPYTAAARPNVVHGAVARLERRGVATAVLTQNVDGLHQRAGSQRVLELHGSLATVACLACGARSARARFQERLVAANPTFAAQYLPTALGPDDVAPDGDVEIPDAAADGLVVPPCEGCGGALKPDVTFFGENVPKPRVERAYALADAADALVVLGSSLTVYSGYRFVRRAKAAGRPVAIVNDGATRGDGDADLRLHARLAPLLERVAAHLGAA